MFLSHCALSTGGGASLALAAEPPCPSLRARLAARAARHTCTLFLRRTNRRKQIYIGETYDGRIAAALAGWNACGFAPSQPQWYPAIAPAISPATYGSIISAHTVLIKTDESYAIAAGGISEPAPGVYVLDFGQNMAGQTELFLTDCPPGTQITLSHAEILYPNGSAWIRAICAANLRIRTGCQSLRASPPSIRPPFRAASLCCPPPPPRSVGIHNNYLPKVPMAGTYICSGAGSESYRTLFSYYGFRYVRVVDRAQLHSFC